MKTLVIVVHPHLEQSRINKAWAERIAKEENVTVHNLYGAYPDGKIDVAREQKLAEAHDRIVFQFPLYWYSTPALLKEWQDVVLTYGWAYGSEGNALHGKELVLAVSAGGAKDVYQAGARNQFTLSELLRPLQAMANLTGLEFLPTHAYHGVYGVSDEALAESAEAYVAHVLNPELSLKNVAL
ncbi:NAD(P)H-dependent oxidoreductase [Brevibacillus dissolubilis]|uniref:NAD(P)H-dependent oxidoreductase n=1 Tax=Brevibacillus dissolubilis TaxID=1844116 RepID=UPI0011169696|nr:NAD(P)H-dependent oxidoreductase [Brevibacillus dissolubilis]